MDVAKYAAIAGYLIPFITIWKFFAEGRVRRKSGKRLAYSFAIASGGSRSLTWFPGLRRRIERSVASGDAQMEIFVFLWNIGTEPITHADLFSEKGLRINVYDARIVAVTVAFEAHAAVGARGTVASSSVRSSEQEMALAASNLSSAEIGFLYLPPAHGAIFSISLRDLKRKVPIVSVVGPIRGLRQTTYEGVIVSLPMKDSARLRRWGRWVGVHVNVALMAMGAMVIGAAVSGVFSSGKMDIRYWAWMAAVLMFELYYLLARDSRRQLIYRIPAKLAYWDPVRCDRD